MSFPPDCNAACKAKIILNSSRVTGEIMAALDHAEKIGYKEHDAYTLIRILDEAEDRLVEFNNNMLNKTGYKRRTDKVSLADFNEKKE